MSDVKEEIMKKTAAEAAVEIQESEAAPDLNQAENSTPVSSDNIQAPAPDKDVKERDLTSEADAQDSAGSEAAEVSEPEKEEAKSSVDSMEDFEIVSLYPGQIIQGKIISVTDDELIVNVGYKSDGIVAKDDILLEDEKPLTEIFNEGEEIKVEVRRVNDGDGNVILSQKNVVKQQAWKEIEEAFKNEIEVSGIGKEVV